VSFNFLNLIKLPIPVEKVEGMIFVGVMNKNYIGYSREKTSF